MTRLVQMATGVSDAVGSAAIKEVRLKKRTQKSMESYDLSMTLFASLGPKRDMSRHVFFFAMRGRRIGWKLGAGSVPVC